MAVAAAANAIVTWAEYKLALPKFSNDTLQDKYQDLINKASARIELYMGWSLKAQDYTGASAIKANGSNRDTVILPVRPINSVSHLYVDEGRTFGASSEIPSSGYSMGLARMGIISLYGGVWFPAGRDVVKVECNAGYQSTSAEWSALQTACIELVTWMASRFDGFIGKKSETNADGMSVGYETFLPANVKDLLDQVKGG